MLIYPNCPAVVSTAISYLEKGGAQGGACVWPRENSGLFFLLQNYEKKSDSPNCRHPFSLLSGAFSLFFALVYFCSHYMW